MSDPRPAAAPSGSHSPDPPAEGGRVRDRLNLIEQIYQAAVASDYEGSAPDPPARGSRRRQRAIVTFVGVGMAGLIIALGFSARVLNAPVVSEQRDALRDRIEQADGRGEALALEVTDLRLKAQDARQADLETSQAGRLVNAQISRYELITGFTAVTGDGATVRMADAKNPTTDDPEVSKVLDADIQQAVNGLWEAGAEAIAVNSQRLTSRSAIRSAAGAILINYRPLQPPYLIEAIGPADLAKRFLATSSATELHGVARRFGIGFDTGRAEDLTLPAAAMSLPDTAEVMGDERAGNK